MGGLHGHGAKLSRKQEALISALLTEPSLHAATELVGIAESTAYRWLKLAAFTHAYREAKRAVVEQAMSQIQRATSKAVTTLLAVMDDADAGASARVSAAKVVLETALRTIELDDLETRIAALEAQTKEPPR